MNPSFLLPGGKVDADAIRAFYASADEDQSPTVRFELGRDVRSRLDKYLTSRVAFMSRSQLQRLIDEGHVLVNGRVGKASTKLRLGDAIALTLPPPASGKIEPEDIAIDVLFEDEHMIVLDKRPDIIVHPARSEKGGTMVNALAWHFAHNTGGALSEVGTEFARPGVVHRLDRKTSGCIVFAKSDEAHWRLADQFQQRTADKRYLAVVHGRVDDDAQVIDLPVGPHPSRVRGYREKQVIRHDDLGKPSVTICRVRERYEPRVEASGSSYTLVELELKTGRTHQIRVHLSHLGYPLVGDDMYGGKPLADATGAILIDRQALHAGLLALMHPVMGEPVVFTAPVHADMAGLIAHLRRGRVERVHVEGTVPLGRFGLGG